MKDEKMGEEQSPYVEEVLIKVDPKQTPIRIDKYLLERLEKISRNKIQIGLTAGNITVDEKKVKPNYKVRPNQNIKVLIPRYNLEGYQLEGEDIPLDIHYEDEDLMIVNKPAGLVVHPGVGNKTGTLVNAVKFYLDNKTLPSMEGNGADRPGLVHRIDKNTSGLIVIAKNEYAISHLSKQFYDHTIERAYKALVWGTFDSDKGTIDVNVGRHPVDRIIMTTFPEGDQGKHAITHYEVLEDMYYVSLVKCKLETGRTHQIRVHLKSQNHPLFNDDRYGGDRVVKGTVYSKYKQFVKNCFDIMPYHALHAYYLGFIHPRTEKFVEFEVPYPKNFDKVVNKWRAYLSAKKN